MKWSIIRGSSLQKTKWRNGRGVSRNIATRLDRSGDLAWQIGLADLAGDAPFSHFPGCDRIFIPVAGDPPPELDVGGEGFAPCPLLVPKRFPGDAETHMRLAADGRAFNVITDRREYRASAQVRRLEAGDPIEVPDAPEVVIHCLEGELSTAGDLIEAGDSLLGPGPAAPAAAATDAVVIVVGVSPV